MHGSLLHKLLRNNAMVLLRLAQRNCHLQTNVQWFIAILARSVNSRVYQEMMVVGLYLGLYLVKRLYHGPRTCWNPWIRCA